MNDSYIRLVFLAHALVTLLMVGVIWFVQLVHYPLLSYVGHSEFPAYEQHHRGFIKWLVAPLMLLEGMTAAFLILFPPAAASDWQLWIGAGLLLVIWISTAFVQVPLHIMLSRGFDPAVQKRLVRTNWWRTIAWSFRGGLVLAMLWSALSTDASMSERPSSLKIGDRAPDFTATTQDGERVQLSDFVGKRGLVLFFYPKDGTAICTKEVCAFRDSYEKFSDAGVAVIGVSGDTEESHRDFIGQHKLSFPLISDKDGSMRKTFAVPLTMGLIPGRVTYVIDQEGIIRQIFSAQFVSNEHVQRALEAVKGFAKRAE
ncbi:MAG: peroxiredoxin [Schlesneria sp.]